jgi:hypothetical protein
MASHFERRKFLATLGARLAARGARAARHAGDRLPQRKIGTGHGTGRDIAGHLSRTWVGQDGTTP